MFSSSLLSIFLAFTAIGLDSTAASPHVVPRDTLSARGNTAKVRLVAPAYTYVTSPAKSNTVGGWGGQGSTSWKFEFEGQYTSEKFTMMTYKKDSEWFYSETEPNLPKEKTLNCKIEVDVQSAPPLGWNVTLQTTDPWITSDGVKVASCSVA